MTDNARLPFKGRGLKVALFIALIGPLTGTLVFMAIPAVRLAMSATSAAFSLSTLADMGGVLLFVLLYGYVFGGVPALLSALLLGWLTARDGTFGYGASALAGAAGAIVGGAGLAVLIKSEDALTPGMAVFLLPFALLSALICRWLIGKTGLLRDAAQTSLARH
ncbi:MAG: hypothetical protein HOP09_02960 [Hyphomicrobium sp.]|nr:hypothetical protein [Hyphomicrobium sp.]